MSGESDSVKRLQEQAATARYVAQQQRSQQSRKRDRTNPHAVNLGHNADVGLDIIRLPDGSIQYASSQTNGAIGVGDAVLVNQGQGLPRIDSNPAINKHKVPSNRFFKKIREEFLFINTALGFSENGKVWVEPTYPLAPTTNEGFYFEDHFQEGIFGGRTIHDIVRGAGQTWVAVGGNSPLDYYYYGNFTDNFYYGNPNSQPPSYTTNIERHLPIAISIDNAKSWTLSLQNADPTDEGGYPGLYGVAYGNGIYVAAGDWGRIWISSDGINWTQTNGRGIQDYQYNVNYQALGADWFDYITDIKFGNGYFLLCTDTGRISKSVDGFTWNTVYDADIYNYTNTDFRRLAYGKNRWVIIAEGLFLYSLNGSTWIEITDSPLIINDEYTIISSELSVALGYGKDKFVAGTTKGSMAYSFDGITWNAIISPFPATQDGSLTAIGYAKNTGWIAASLRSGFSISQNGISWSEAFVPQGNTNNIYFNYVERIYSRKV